MDETEKLLRSLFDFQRFEGNERLNKVIRSVEGDGNGLPLEDSRLELNAAGEPDTWRIRMWEDDKR